jgi:hypothetical protein
MPILLNADRTKLRLTTDNTAPNNGQQLPSMLAAAAFTNPCPVMPNATQTNGAGTTLVKQCTGAGGQYGWLGFCHKPAVAAGDLVPVLRGVVIDGFTGCTPGLPVYVDQTAADADLAGAPHASGLTHTYTAQALRIGVALTATKIRFD